MWMMQYPIIKVPGSIPRIILERCCKQEYSVILLNQLVVRNKNIKLILNYVVGPLVFCLLTWSIYSDLQARKDDRFSFADIFSAADTTIIAEFILAALLMFVNWGIEARKWQLLLRPNGNISFRQSYKSILSGNTFAFFTPNRIGEYFGRMFHIDSRKRVGSVPVTLACSMAQLLVTLTAGVAALFVLREQVPTLFNSMPAAGGALTAISYALLILALVLTIFYFRLNAVIRWVSSLSICRRWTKGLTVWEGVNATLLFRVLSLSCARYLVFIAQYYLLFRVFKVDINWWQAFWTLSLVFLLIALVPGVGFLTELGVRWKSCFHLLQLFSPNAAGIFAVSLLIWIINMVIPAIAGAILILRIKFIRKTGTGFT
jgi:hypothetical protein